MVAMVGKIFSTFLYLLLTSIAAEAADLEQEKHTLLRIKSYWNNPPSLRSWINASSMPHCSWPGISCTAGMVTNISLIDRVIDGDVPAFICSLTNLTVLDLYNNSIRNSFPTFQPNCTNLVHLNLGQNYLNGSLPSDINRTLSKDLLYLNLGGNEISGGIPRAIAEFEALQALYLDNNYFTRFPVEIGMLTNLEILTLAENPFLATPLPPEFEMLTKLKYLWISEGNLVGEIPGWIGRLEQLEHLDLAVNNLTGMIPTSIWGLKNLRYLYLYQNKLHGEILGEIRALELEEIDISTNYLSGSIPEDFAKLQKLKVLFMYYNHFSGGIPTSISHITSLEDIRLFGNNLTGSLSWDLGRYSNLYNLEINGNSMTGELPDGLCAGRNLAWLSLQFNNFSGRIPESLGKCPTLRSIKINHNHFFGKLPPNIWSVPNLNTLMLNDNNLSGEIPNKLPWNLTILDISNNRFSGRIPSAAGIMTYVYGSNNAFTGKLPVSFAGMCKIQELRLDGNMLSGDIHSSIEDLQGLTSLDLSRNQLTGTIPDIIGSLLRLKQLNLSNNRLSGDIPSTLGRMQLNSLDLSFNSLTGPIPPLLLNKAYRNSFNSNPGLCANAPFFQLPPCTNASKNSRKLTKGSLIVVTSLGSIVFLIVLVIGVLSTRRLPKKKLPRDSTNWKITYFEYLDFTDSDVLRFLTPENLIGVGGSGEVYRMAVENSQAREVVAVKKIWNKKHNNLQLEKQFLAEVEILGSIRHINIVKLLCCIFNEELKLIVFEYMENGSLHNWLHKRQSVESVRSLDWPTRLEIAVGTARGLCYMHHHCNPPIVHWDVKSSNILLDSDFKPKVADFGLARILANRMGEANIVSVLAGTFGYMAPECAHSNKVDVKVDVYSFGVVLLELVTGKQAHEGDSENSLAQWVWVHFQTGGSMMEVVSEDIKNPSFIKEITVVIKLGLLCTETLPCNRPTMKQALNILLRCTNMHANLEQGTPQL